jgi:hypothetical protein
MSIRGDIMVKQNSMFNSLKIPALVVGVGLTVASCGEPKIGSSGNDEYAGKVDGFNITYNEGFMAYNMTATKGNKTFQFEDSKNKVSIDDVTDSTENDVPEKITVTIGDESRTYEKPTSEGMVCNDSIVPYKSVDPFNQGNAQTLRVFKISRGKEVDTSTIEKKVAYVAFQNIGPQYHRWKVALKKQHEAEYAAKNSKFVKYSK